jgi:hypothetical protein
MSTSSKKEPRKLQLLPEVLPAPRADGNAAGGNAAEGNAPRPSPRERTVSRLSKLMAVAAAGAALAGCGGDEKSGATTGDGAAGTPPAATGAASAGQTASAAVSASGAPSTSATAEIADAGADAAAEDAGPHDAGADAAPSGSAKPKPAQQWPKRDKGYQVVDMLPSPSRGGKLD